MILSYVVLLLLLTIQSQAFALGTIAWDAQAGINQYKFEDTLNNKVWIDNSAVEAELGASYALNKIIARLELGYASSIGDAKFTQNGLKLLALYPINDFTLLGGYQIRNSAIDKFGNGVDTDISIAAKGFDVGASYRFPHSQFVASLTLSPLKANIDNHAINASASESTTATSARVSYAYKSYKLSLVYASFAYDSVSETALQVKILRPF